MFMLILYFIITKIFQKNNSILGVVTVTAATLQHLDSSDRTVAISSDSSVAIASGTNCYINSVVYAASDIDITFAVEIAKI